MRKVIGLGISVIMCFSVVAQNPATVFTIPNRNISLPCGTSCTPISFSVPHIKQTNNYVVTNPPYLPYAFTTPAGTAVTSIYNDDTWSQKISLPFAFSFCFFGINYPSLLMGSNSAITFDTTKFGTGSGYLITPGTGGIPNTAYAPAMIFGPYHDIDPSLTTSPNKKIEYRVEGTAPRRRFIASYFEIAYFGTACTGQKATHQMVLYENTGIIEVYIHDKPYCINWNNGLTILGIQNQARTVGVAATGKNATVWGNTGMDSCFRFVPSGGTPMFKRAELLVNNVVVATNTTDTSSGAAGILNVNFSNVCPTLDSTAYVVKVVYGSCSNPALELSYSDTVFVKRNTLAATTTKANATCFANGSITVNGTGGVAPLQYSINGGAYQSSNMFNNLPPGTYTVTARDASLCTFSVPPVTIALQGAITVNAGVDSSLCLGGSFIRTATSDGASFAWTPTTGVSNPTIANPSFSPQTTTVYTVTASTVNCIAQSSFKATVLPVATANAGPDRVIITGDIHTMQANGSPGTYLWTPAYGLNLVNTLNPSASPAQTTTYKLKITNLQGCVATDSMIITVVPYCIKPMEAFSPNGDGINDLWLVTNGTGCLTKAKAEVFNRYGAKIFESNDYKNNWNGTFNGKLLADGTYYYVITYRLINGKDQYLKGSVTILR